MGTDAVIQGEFGSFEDEVMNAGWVPPQPVHTAATPHLAVPAEAELDVDGFLQSVYSAQE
ncbi:MAG: hypothetical protein JSR19_02245 [Proteobacteria bacterium]|nr:hypothetical protein [Pseudomonadota bacterium]HQR03618.1 hypothetical protein [Rhodocyclaceae bacterium]